MRVYRLKRDAKGRGGALKSTYADNACPPMYFFQASSRRLRAPKIAAPFSAILIHADAVERYFAMPLRPSRAPLNALRLPCAGGDDMPGSSLAGLFP